MSKHSFIGLVVAVVVFVAVQLFQRTHAEPPPKQPILHGDGGRFRCQREADVWVQLAAGACPGRTPNDADMWLQAWRDRGGSCEH